MNFKWIPERRILKSIEQLNFHNNIQLTNVFRSPTIQFLREIQKVQRTKEIFENVLSFESHHKTTNHWISEHDSKDKKVVKKTEPDNDKLRDNREIHDLIKYEENYIKELEFMHQTFSEIMEKTPGYMSMIIKNCHISLSGSISEIIDLHKNKILPKFQKSESCINILKYLLQSIEDGDFYCYVIHAMLYNSSHKWIDNFKFILDKSGIKYNKLENIDIMTLYRDWTDKLCNYLLKDPRQNAEEIALCMDVEDKLCRIIYHVSSAEKIAYIKEVSKNNIEGIEKLYQALEKNRAINHPMLILFPRYDYHYGYRNPIDVLKLGQFVRIWNENSMLSKTSKCFYNTKLFIFERCVIYTIIINENEFSYNGHFWIKDCKFESVLKNDKPTTFAILHSGDRQLILDNAEFVNAVLRLYDLHKYDEIEAEIELEFDTHVRILSKIDACNLRRLTLANNN